MLRLEPEAQAYRLWWMVVLGKMTAYRRLCLVGREMDEKWGGIEKNGAVQLEESVLLAMANINHANVKMTEKYGRDHLVEKDSILKNVAIPALTTYLNHAVE